MPIGPISLRGASVQDFPFDLTGGFPGFGKLDHLGLEQADDAFGGGVVLAIPFAADPGVDPGFSRRLGGDRRGARSFVERAVALRRREIRAGIPQDVVGGPKRTNLRSSFLIWPPLGARWAGTLCGVSVFRSACWHQTRKLSREQPSFGAIAL